MTRLSPEQKLKFIEQGRVFGYPRCCCEAFLLRFDMPVAELMAEPPRKLHGTGFVPCLECNKKSEEELCSIIKENRVHPTPFPHA